MADDARRWFEHSKGFQARTRRPTSDDGPDLWTRCPSCGEALFNEALAAQHRVCPVCSHHFRLDARERVAQLADPVAAESDRPVHDADLRSVDTLAFVDSKPYGRRLRETEAKLGFHDAFHAVSCTIEGVEVELGAFDFRFMGGSMGSVVGEAVTRVFERATARRVPAVVVSASGGARMQEGVLSLMQMAKTSAAAARLKDDARMPYISVLTHPTTGGVAASFAMLGDLILAEPGALVGFAGPRVIKETIGQDLPEGFQTAEYLLEHGLIDAIVPRNALRGTIARTLRMLTRAPEPCAPQPSAAPPA